MRRRPAKTLRQRRSTTIPPWVWAAPIGVILLVGTFFLGRYVEAERWRVDDAPPEIVKVWEGYIDLRAGHPDDPDKRQAVTGVSDEQIVEMSDEDVDLLLSDWVIDVAAAASEPRYLFALGRVALIHDQIETAYDLLDMANDAGSVPAPMYLAAYFEREDPEQARQLVESAIAMGFKPASDYWETLFGRGAANTDLPALEATASGQPASGNP